MSKLSERVGIYKELMPQDGFTLDSATEFVGAIAQANDKMVQLDSALGEDTSLSKVVAGTIIDLQKDGLQFDTYKLDAVFSATAKVLDTVDLDSVGGVQGSEVVASMIKANIYTILSATVPFSGTMTDVVARDSSKSNTKFKMLVVEPIVSRAKAGFSEGEGINGLNAGNPLANTSRNETQLYVTDTKVYTFNAKAKDGDTENIAIERGTNSVIIAGNVFVEDYDASATTGDKYTQLVTVEGQEVKVEFNYSAGTIVLTFADNVTAGTKMYFEAGLSTAEMSKITSAIKSDIRDYNYVAQTYALDTEISVLKARELLQNTGINIATNDLSVALSKMASEIKQRKIDCAVALATSFGTTVDVAGADESVRAERYKRVLEEVESAKADIVKESGLSSQVVLVGGNALLKIYTGLSAIQTKTNVIASNENAIRFIGYLNGSIPCYYNPRHDIDYPKNGDGEDTFFVVGNPSDPAKKPVLDGIGLPILPDNGIGTDLDGNKVTRLSGKIIVSANKDPRARKQVRELKVKL